MGTVIQAASCFKNKSAAWSTGIDDPFCFIDHFLFCSEVHDLCGKSAGDAGNITQDPLCFCHIHGFKVIKNFSFRDFCKEFQAGIILAFCKNIRDLTDFDDCFDDLF